MYEYVIFDISYRTQPTGSEKTRPNPTMGERTPCPSPVWNRRRHPFPWRAVSLLPVRWRSHDLHFSRSQSIWRTIIYRQLLLRRNVTLHRYWIATRQMQLSLVLITKCVVVGDACSLQTLALPAMEHWGTCPSTSSNNFFSPHRSSTKSITVNSIWFFKSKKT